VAGQQQVVLGIRPEDIEFADAPGRHTVTGVVQVVQPRETSTTSSRTSAASRRTSRRRGEVHVEEGARIRLEFPEACIHMFDGQTGDAVVNREEPEDITPPIVTSE